MDILLSESNCPNAIAYINASPSRCPPAPGSDSQLCSVVVTYTPTRVGYRLTKYNCQKYQQQQQNTQGSVGTVSQGRATQASTLISPPSFTTSGHLSTITNPPNTGSPNTITVSVPNLRANIGTNPQQITPNQAFTQAGQQNLRPSIGASQNLFQAQQPIGTAPTSTGTQVGATTNVQVNTGFPGSTMGFNPGTTNAAGSINLTGLGPRLPQTNRLQNPISGVNIGPTNPGSSINLRGMGSMLPQTNLPQNVNSRVGGSVQTGRSQIAVPGQINLPGQMQTISLTGTQTQFTPRSQPTNNAGITTAAGIPFQAAGIPFQQPQINPQNPNFRASNSGQMGQGQIAGQGQIGVPGQRLGGPQTQFIPRAAGVNLQQTGQIDSQVTAAANFATNAYNAKIRQQFSTEDKWYTLIDISNVQRQIRSGLCNE
ncbi:hypothetical protein LOTGIDRAFT_160356 [Lottia gigantea]|uniref:Uncharacterized protein n=1 Tax=Lottia gigantea TaxID=225164 RepID=V4C2Q8_LOTGI|nr:hypothetical protein LOTGIDRAFT_160356 [Lottia gigantea]ESO95809.1 hypothetical protein LOTGIDRAFT_160356 [Lottia gigantea]